MRKLYTRNSALESQLAIMQAPQSCDAGQESSAPSVPTGGDVDNQKGNSLSLLRPNSILRPSTTPARGQMQQTPISLLHQKDAVIGQLQASLSSSQRQVGLLRAALERGDGTNASGSRPCSRSANRSARKAESSSGNLNSGAMVPNSSIAVLLSV